MDVLAIYKVCGKTSTHFTTSIRNRPKHPISIILKSPAFISVINSSFKFNCIAIILIVIRLIIYRLIFISPFYYYFFYFFIFFFFFLVYVSFFLVTYYIYNIKWTINNIVTKKLIYFFRIVNNVTVCVRGKRTYYIVMEKPILEIIITHFFVYFNRFSECLSNWLLFFVITYIFSYPNIVFIDYMLIKNYIF